VTSSECIMSLTSSLIGEMEYRAMTRNEELYPDPYTFKPERFFNKNGELNLDDRVLAYGFGRR
jgi:cytochrome P450